MQAMKDDPEYLKIAFGYLEQNIQEIPGIKAHPMILKFLESVDGAPEELIVTDETPWCSAFVNNCVEEAGLEGTESLAASSWKNWGHEVEYGERGAITLIYTNTGSGYHVCFFVDSDEDGVFCLGGNQSNRVKISKYSWDKVAHFRLPNS
jgi:uncharacterized protein (TIGR02594 family)